MRLNQELADAVIDYLPCPQDNPIIHGFTADDNEKPITRKRELSEPLSLLVFKIMSDPFVGHLAYARIYSGVLKVGSAILNTRLGKKERVAKILQMHANQRTEVDSLGAGQICAIAGLKFLAVSL